MNNFFLGKLNVLVLGVGGNVSIGILKTLNKIKSIDMCIYGACVTKNAAGFAFCNYSLICPMVSEKGFNNWLTNIEDKYNIDVVLSGVEEVNEVLAERSEIGRRVVYLSPKLDSIKMFSDKFSTAMWLKENGLNYPKTIEITKELGFNDIVNQISLPFIVKPKRGKGSQGVHLINEKTQIESVENINDCVAQQYIGTKNSEYTCGVFPSPNGCFEVIIMQRELKNGSTSIAQVIEDDTIKNYCRNIAEKINVECPFNIQLRVDVVSNEPYCFEINMRLSGTTFIRHNFGFPDCEAWLISKIYPDRTLPDFKVKIAKAIRFESEVFVDLEEINSINENEAVKLEGAHL